MPGADSSQNLVGLALLASGTPAAVRALRFVQSTAFFALSRCVLKINSVFCFFEVPRLSRNSLGSKRAFDVVFERLFKNVQNLERKY